MTVNRSASSGMSGTQLSELSPMPWRSSTAGPRPHDPVGPPVAVDGLEPDVRVPLGSPTTCDPPTVGGHRHRDQPRV